MLVFMCLDLCFQESAIFDSRLNFTQSQQEVLLTKHLPHGLPALDDVTGGVTCVLHQEDFVTGYSGRLRMPLFSAFSLNQSSVSTPTSASFFHSALVQGFLCSDWFVGVAGSGGLSSN